ncbi:7-cyano-7-deazaguanine synthase QueC [Candidatus Dependentiae bacterium]|nr:7-cyano-7-deazaguanine synthase QueC [Candidatus Dependentiae bacterium]
MNKVEAIVLVSGGLDSCVTASIAVREYNCAFLHFGYGQRTQDRELKAFHNIADFNKIEEKIILNVDFLKIIGGSSLTDSSIKLGSTEINGIPDTYVPFRNGIFLSITAAYAETVRAEKIFIGAVWEDSSGYPDCQPVFYEKFNLAIKQGTRPGSNIEIITPLIHKTKSEIIKMGISNNAPLELTWSCYQNEDRACGICESCKLRIKGFKEAGIIDPINYI